MNTILHCRCHNFTNYAYIRNLKTKAERLCALWSEIAAPRFNALAKVFSSSPIVLKTRQYWQQFANRVNQIVQKYFKGLPSPSERINQRRPHLKPLTEAEKAKFKTNQYLNPVSEEEFDLSAREVRFSPKFRQISLFKALNNEGKETLFDLREFHEIKSLSVKYYAPFKIHEIRDQIYCSFNDGWLILMPNSENGLHIGRIDNFAKESRLGSALIQFAIEKSLESGFGGKVSLISTNASSVFYYKLGFVCKNPEIQKEVEKAYQANIPGPDGREMYLPAEAIEAWKQKIAENRISN